MKKIYGFDNLKQQFIDNFVSNRLHHCNMIAGIRGVGKMQFILDLASIILSQKEDKFSINENEIELTKKLIESGGHTDLTILDINTIDDSGKENLSKKAEINVKQVRKTIDEIKLTPSISKNKVLIIDSIDNVNINGQNALLKTLEEPTKNTYIFLVCHNLNKVINTILSRSNITFAPDLTIEDWGQTISDILESEDIDFDYDIQTLYDISDHSIGKALEMINCKALNLYENMIDIVCNNLDLNKFQKIFDYSGSNEMFCIFSTIISKLFENIIKFYRTNNENIFTKNTIIIQEFLKKNSIDNIINRYENIKKAINETNIYSLDKKQTINVILTNYNNII